MSDANNTLLTLRSPVAETPDIASHRSNDNDFAYETPHLGVTFARALLATILCLPIGALALKNVYKVCFTTNSLKRLKNTIIFSLWFKMIE